MWEMQTVVTEPVRSVSQRLVIDLPVAVLTLHRHRYYFASMPQIQDFVSYLACDR